MPNALPAMVEERVLSFAIAHPGLGPRRWPPSSVARSGARSRSPTRRCGASCAATGSRAGGSAALERLGVRHTRIRAGRPQTNGHVEALHRTILDECWRPAFARYLHLRLTGLRRELETYIDYFNFDRVHHGRLTRRTHPRRARLRCPQCQAER